MRGQHRAAPLVDEGESWSYAWSLVLGAGAVLFVVGLVDVVLAWYPLRPADPLWEFGAVGRYVSSLPVLATGLALVGAAAVLTERRATARMVATLGLVLAMTIVAGYVAYLVDVPFALRMATSQTEPRIRESIVRVTFMSLAFSALFFGVGVSVIRHLYRNPV